MGKDDKIGFMLPQLAIVPFTSDNYQIIIQVQLYFIFNVTVLYI
jgi:hypothetical protein